MQYWFLVARLTRALMVQIPVKAPETAVGELEITYLDQDLR